MPKRIVIIQGHPDPEHEHFGHALADAYTRSAVEAGHDVRTINIATLDFPLLHTKKEWETGTPPESIVQAQSAIAWAEHLVILYPLWLGALPALLKGFLEQVFRPGFAIASGEKPGQWRKLLAGRSARIVVTMGMPAFVYRWYFGAYALKSLERNILKFCGIGPIKESVIGMVESMSEQHRQRWLETMRELGREGH